MAGARHLAPLWTIEGALTPEPATKMVPFLWPYAEVKELLTEAGTLISAHDAERRVLAFRNPGTDPKDLARTTDTLWAAIQLVLPGEVAPAHRHLGGGPAIHHRRGGRVYDDRRRALSDGARRCRAHPKLVLA